MIEQHELHNDTHMADPKAQPKRVCHDSNQETLWRNLKQTQGLLFTSSMTPDIETSKEFIEVCLRTRLTRICDDDMRGHNEMTHFNKLNVHTTKLMVKWPFVKCRWTALLHCFNPLQQSSRDENYLPPGVPRHGKLEKVAGTTHNRSRFPRRHRNVEWTNQYLPFLVTQNW